MHQKLALTAARLFARKLAGRRAPKHQHGSRNDIFRQAQQGAVLFTVFQNIPNIARANAQALRSRHGVLRRNAGVRHGKQKVARAGPARRTAAGLIGVQPFLTVCTEDQHHRRLGNKGLMVARFTQGLLQGAVGNIQNGVKLLVARRGRLKGCTQNGLLFLRGDF